MEESEIIKKIEEFVLKEFNTVPDVRIAPEIVNLVGKVNQVLSYNLEIEFCIIKGV